MAVQAEEKTVKVKKQKISKGSKDETKQSVPTDTTGDKSETAPLIKLQESQMKEALVAFKKLVELRDSEDKKQDLLGSACGEGRKVQVSVAAIKLPRVSDAQVLKLLLPHPTTPVTRDVCLIVKDFEKGIRPDHEPTVAHYEALLAEKGVKGVTKVMSLRELKVEYKTFESKTALSHLYDHFLVDARIIRLVPKFLGKPFYKRKKFPVQVKLDAKDLVKEMEKALSTSCLALAHTGTSSCVTIGLTSMPEEQLSSNLVAAVRLLETRYPGGWANIRALHLLSGTDSLPFYATLRATKEVGLVRGLKRKNKGLVSGELSTVVGATVTVTPTGGVKVKRVKDPLWPEDGDQEEEVTNEVAEFNVEAGEPREKKSKKEEKKAKAPKKQTAEEDSDDEMEDKEMAYMQKIADEEEEMEKNLEVSEDKLEEKLKEKKGDESDEEGDDDEEDEDEADDDAEAENLLSEGEDSESEDELIMKKPDFQEDDEEEEAPAAKKGKKGSKKPKPPKASPSNPKEKAKSGKKAQKQKKFVDQKKKAKLSKGKK